MFLDQTLDTFDEGAASCLLRFRLKDPRVKSNNLVMDSKIQNIVSNYAVFWWTTAYFDFMVLPCFLCTNDVQGVKYMRISLFLFQPDFLDFLDLGFFCFLYGVV